eukprot:c4594_g1_i1 orf=335-622(-)
MKVGGMLVPFPKVGIRLFVGLLFHISFFLFLMHLFLQEKHVKALWIANCNGCHGYSYFSCNGHIMDTSYCIALSLMDKATKDCIGFVGESMLSLS